MTTVRSIGVQLSLDIPLTGMLASIDAAYRRAAKAEPGERGDIARYETLAAALEVHAANALLAGAATETAAPTEATLHSGMYARFGKDLTVLLTLPLHPGLTDEPAGGQAPPPSETVEPRDDLRGRELAAERLRSQLAEAIAHPGKDRSSVLCPSGIHNRVLTEVLREHVTLSPEQPMQEAAHAVEVPVVYRDGSQASHPFPFRCVHLTDHLDDDTAAVNAGVTVLRMALLSIRHTEMDAVVDGAWLRNVEVSKPRPAGLTDDYVYTHSHRQLTELTEQGTRRLRLYVFQTGLETAVVGFYRAVTRFLAAHPGQLEVIPMFYTQTAAGESEDPMVSFERGQPWAAAVDGGAPA